MEDLLTYSKYERVLCIVFDDDERLVIKASSNRAIQMETQGEFRGYTLQGISAKPLKEYLDACAKEQDQQNQKEKHAILIVQQHARQLRQKLLEDERIVLERCQFLFILPFGWTCNEYMDGLRALFMETEWIHQNDPKNRLIFSPFIECHIANYYKGFEREKKYLLLSLDKTTIHLSSFQMQSAKELIAVSKKLAASDFLLLPTDLGVAVTMDISDRNRLIYNTVKEMVIRQVSNIIQRKRFYQKNSFWFKNGNKKITRKQHSNMNGATRSLFSVKILRRIIEEIINTLYEILFADKDKQLHKLLPYYLKGSKEILRGLTCGILMNSLLTDSNIKGIIDQVVCKVKELYSKYSKFHNSPDGIQDILLFCHIGNSHFYIELFRMALFDANLIDAQNGFINQPDICSGAMQKPFKMVQIANALLPPTIWKDGNSKQLEWTDYNTREKDLLPPNSFYIQAYINDDHIRFILNKAIAVSSVNGTVQKSTFTIQETSVELESIFDSVCDTMWNHLLMPECQQNQDLFDQCDTHLAGEYSAADYYFFKCSIQEMTEKLLQGDFAKCHQDIDSNHAIPISKECNCSFQISLRTLINIGMQPAVSHIATIIASSLASNSFFGPYTVSALIIMDDSKEMLLEKQHNFIFEKTLQRCLQAHHGRTIVFYSRESVMAAYESLGSWCTGLQQVFGKGSYSQVSSTDYVLKFFDTRMGGTHARFEMYKCHSNSLKKGDSLERPNEFVILKRGQAIDSSGTIHTFYPRNSKLNHIILRLYTINRHENKEHYNNLYSQGTYFAMVKGYPLTVRVTPQHHSSTIEFEVSDVEKEWGVEYPAFRSFSIQERLALK